MASEIPKATLAAGDQSDPAWWLACAEYHEKRATLLAHVLAVHESAYHSLAQQCSAAALACRTFAAMMERGNRYLRENPSATALAWWIHPTGPTANALVPQHHIGGDDFRSLPAAAVAALTED
jgi:hypothetical protein